MKTGLQVAEKIDAKLLAAQRAVDDATDTARAAIGCSLHTSMKLEGLHREITDLRTWHFKEYMSPLRALSHEEGRRTRPEDGGATLAPTIATEANRA